MTYFVWHKRCEWLRDESVIFIKSVIVGADLNSINIKVFQIPLRRPCVVDLNIGDCWWCHQLLSLIPRWRGCYWSMSYYLSLCPDYRSWTGRQPANIIISCNCGVCFLLPKAVILPALVGVQIHRNQFTAFQMTYVFSVLYFFGLQIVCSNHLSPSDLHSCVINAYLMPFSCSTFLIKDKFGILLLIFKIFF